MGFFYSNISGNVQKVLNTRKAYYNKELRDSSTHAWLYKKIAWTAASAKNVKTGKSATLAVPKKGGLGTDGMYTSTPSNDKSVKHFPKPHITSVTISNIGDFGSVRKAQMSFTIYTINELDRYQPFFDIGAELTISFGWTDAGGGGGSDGRFSGIVSNFSYSLSSDGSFNCTTDAIGAGSSLASVNINMAKNPELKLTDTLGNKLHDTDLISLYHNVYVDRIKTIKDKSGFVIVRYGLDWGDANSDTKTNNTRYPHLYVSLERIIKDINTIIQQQSTAFNAIQIYCDEAYSKGNVPKYDENFVSANPTEILFPGFCDYGGANNFDEYFKDVNGEDYSSQFTGYADLSKIMISYECLLNIYKSLGTDTNKQQKSSSTTVSTFLNKIFDTIHLHSGGRFKLSLATNPEGGNDLFVVDSNFEEDPKNITAYEFTAITQGSMVRDMSLTSKVPSDFQAVAFVAATGNTSSTALNQNTSPVAKLTGASNTNLKTDEEVYNSALASMANEGPTAQNVSALQSALKHKVATAPIGPKFGNEIIPYPLDLSVTIDGIDGIVFGNTITTNYVPNIYKRPGTELSFTVTNVTHTISGGDWTTKLDTVCRLVVDNTAPATVVPEPSKYENSTYSQLIYERDLLNHLIAQRVNNTARSANRSAATETELRADLAEVEKKLSSLPAPNYDLPSTTNTTATADATATQGTPIK